jgi:hypothetical protein
VPFLEWRSVGEVLHWQMLRDASGHCDSALLTSYKGHTTVLNTADANAPNGNVPLAPYVGGSGFPISFGELYDESYIRDHVAKINRLARSGLRPRPGRLFKELLADLAA